MGETCERCGRIRAERVDDFYDTPGLCGDDLRGICDDECRRLEVAAAFDRGIDRGVEIAKAELVVLTYPDESHEKDWTDVDAAAAKAKWVP